MIDAADAEYLLGRPEFLRLLYGAIQAAGILNHEGPAHGLTPRDLSYAEGRRSLGFEILHAAHAGQPEAIRNADASAIATLHAVIREALNPKEKPRATRNETDRYNDIRE